MLRLQHNKYLVDWCKSLLWPALLSTGSAIPGDLSADAGLILGVIAQLEH